jgi:hypothetical protein
MLHKRLGYAWIVGADFQVRYGHDGRVAGVKENNTASGAEPALALVIDAIHRA